MEECERSLNTHIVTNTKPRTHSLALEGVQGARVARVDVSLLPRYNL